MDKTIFKYKLKPEQRQQVLLPVGSEILTIQEQMGDMVMWALIDNDESEYEPRIIDMIMTGHSIPEQDMPRSYIATVQSGYMVFHFFEFNP